MVRLFKDKSSPIYPLAFRVSET